MVFWTRGGGESRSEGRLGLMYMHIYTTLCRYMYRLSCVYMYIHYHMCRKWQPTPVFLPGESRGRRSLVGYSPPGRKESDTTSLSLFFHLAERWCFVDLFSKNGFTDFPLFFYSLLSLLWSLLFPSANWEMVKDREAWHAAVYVVAKSQTQLKWLSSSSSYLLLCTSIIISLGL